MGCNLATHLSSIGSSNTSTGTGDKVARLSHYGDVVVDSVAPRAKSNAKGTHVRLVEAVAFHETPCDPRELPARIFLSAFSTDSSSCFSQSAQNSERRPNWEESLELGRLQLDPRR
jgi:hypothetical protein